MAGRGEDPGPPSLASKLRAARAEATDDLSEPPDDLDAEEWRVVLHYLAPEVTNGGAGLGDGTPGAPEVLPRAGRGGAGGAFGRGSATAGTASVGGASWRRGVVQVAERCYPGLPRARALHRVNVVLSRPHVRLAVDAFRDHEALAVADHRALLRERAFEMLTIPPPLEQSAVDPETGEARVVPTSARDLAAWQMAQVATMRFVADLDGHWAKDREEAAARRLGAVSAAREAAALRAGHAAGARGDSDVAADLRGKLALAARPTANAGPTPPANDVDGVAPE